MRLRKRPYGWCALSAIAGMLALVSSARAGTQHFSLPVQADGMSLGSAAGTFKVTSLPGGALSWSLTDAAFKPAPLADGKVSSDETVLNAAGQTHRDAVVFVKEFTVTVQPSTGVDVTYRFRLSVALAGDTPKSFTVDQEK